MKISVLTPTIRPSYLAMTKECLDRQTFKGFEWLVEIGIPNGKFTLPEDMNKLIKRAQGDIIVILQDCITIPDDALESIVALQYDKVAWTFPVGKKVGEEVKYDWRTGFDLMFEVQANEWETDFACAPKQMFLDIGGYDERFRDGWSWENVEVGWRAAAAGYKFMCNPEVKAVAIDHDSLIEHPHREVLPNNDRLADLTRKNAEFGRFKLEYL